jgi:hypothetical protein
MTLPIEYTHASRGLFGGSATLNELPSWDYLVASLLQRVPNLSTDLGGVRHVTVDAK